MYCRIREEYDSKERTEKEAELEILNSLWGKEPSTLLLVRRPYSASMTG
jgi:hypothetical protein